LSLVSVLLIVHVPVPVHEGLAANLTKKGVTYLGAGDEYPSYLHLLSPSDRAEVEKAQRNIEKYRKSNATIVVVDEKGTPLKNVEITFNHTDHNFLFGFNDFQPFALGSASMMREAGFNTFVATPYWVDTQVGPNEINWDSLERQRLEVIRSMGFKVKVHPLVYLVSWNVPPFLRTVSPAQIANETVRFLTILLQKVPYANIYELSNEDNWESRRRPLSIDEYIHLLKQVAVIVRKTQENATITINTTHTFEEYAESFGYRYPNMSPMEWYKLLISQGVDFDAIGIQYRPGCLWGTPPSDYAFNRVPSLTEVSQKFDAYATLRKRIHITEFALPSIQLPKMEKYGNLEWNETVQAAYVEGFYTLMFGKQAADALIWWFCSSAQPTRPEENEALPFKRGSSSLTPKLSYYTLKNLFTNRWVTRGKGFTDADGIVTFSGFGGKYALTIAYDGLIKRVNIHVNDGVSASYRIIFDKSGVSKEMEAERVKLQNEVQNALQELERIHQWSETLNKAKSDKILEWINDLLRLRDQKRYVQVIELAKGLTEDPFRIQLNGRLTDFEGFTPILTDSRNDAATNSPPGTDLTEAYAFADSSSLHLGIKVLGDTPNRKATFTVQIKTEDGVYHANVRMNGTLCTLFQYPQKEGDVVYNCPFALGEFIEMRIPLWSLRPPRTIYLNKIWIWDESTRKDFDGYEGPQVKIPCFTDFLSVTVTETKTLHSSSTTTCTGYTLIGAPIESLLPLVAAIGLLVILGIVVYRRRGRCWQTRQAVRSAVGECPSQVTSL